ncbi:MAG: hypothetical protein KDD11_03410 [Acidobacteria bacterium]|nr:hypothetical protein [Acidobacteriota bacterium]
MRTHRNRPRAVTPRSTAAGGFLALLLLVAAAPGSLADEASPAPEDLRAQSVAERTLEAMGGRDAWQATHVLRFTFAGARTHVWDRLTGRHRLDGTTREGQRYTVLDDLGQRTGRVWIDGEEIHGRTAEDWLDRAYGAWVNDTYWLLMPYKLLDPGVHLAYGGRQTFDGRPCDVLELAFGSVGLTPGDRYTVYVDADTGLVAGWAYVLESFDPGQEATAWTWGNWQRYGGILLASERKMVGGDRELPLTEIAVYDRLPDSVFEDPVFEDPAPPDLSAASGDPGRTAPAVAP